MFHLFCIRLVFHLWFQAWLFVHGVFCVFNSLTKPKSCVVGHIYKVEAPGFNVFAYTYSKN